MKHILILLLLSLLIIYLPNLNKETKFNLYIFSTNNIITQLLFINLIFFTLLENNIIGTLLLIIFYLILTEKNTTIKEGFISYYENKKK